MNTYLNLFKTKAEADAAVYDENNTPNVSYCEEDESVKYTEKIVPAWMDMVDLGLPSGTLWAKANLGAESETEYGKYFQWGDTVGYTDASHSTWQTTPFNHGSGVFNNTYFIKVIDDVCPNKILAPQYDAACQASNGVMRMPFKEEYRELIANTTNTWTTINGVNGYKFTSKSNPSKYIFIPAAGVAANGNISSQGSFSCVWSSTIYNNYQDSMRLYFSSDSVNVDNSGRNYGYSIRGVCSK